MIVGTVLLLVGLVALKVDSVTFNAPTVKLVAHQVGEPKADLAALAPRTVTIPPWFRYVVISSGAILALHALGMPKPK